MDDYGLARTKGPNRCADSVGPHYGSDVGVTETKVDKPYPGPVT